MRVVEVKELTGKTSLISQSLKCRTITPMLMHGGDKNNNQKPASAQLRIPSIKGIIRYWYRALEVKDSETMYKQEVAWFGGSSDQAVKSKLILSLDKPLVSTTQEKMLPHRPRSFTTYGIPVNSNFTLHVQTLIKDEPLFERLLTYVQLSLYLGGFGQRSRRGFGSIELVEESFPTVEAWLQHVKALIGVVSDIPITLHSTHLAVDNITGRVRHPLLQAVYVGAAYSTADEALKAINLASHDAAKQFSGALGSAKPRYASPLIGSVKKIGGKYYPVITEVMNKSDDRRYDGAKRLFLEKVGVRL